MTEIALYETLKKIPDVTEAEAKEAVADVASSKEVATKADIEKIRTEIAEAKTTLIMWMVGIGLAIVGLIRYFPPA